MHVAHRGAKLAACFAEGTSPEVMEKFLLHLFTAEDGAWPIPDIGDGGAAYNAFESDTWSGSQGSPRALTWSFVPDGLNIASGIGEGSAPSELFARMDSLFAAQGGRATWVSRFQMVFDRWEALSGLDFTRITFGGNDWDDGAFWGAGGNASRGDIRICMKPIDGGSGVLGYTFFPSNGDMVLDRQESWNSSSTQHVFMRNTVSHELGHGVGIEHVCSNNSSILLEPFISTSFDGPRHDDLRAMQRHYGDPFEDNNSAAAAADLGVINNNSSSIPSAVPPPSIANGSLLSIDADGEQDWFIWDILEPSIVSVAATPIGLSYDDSDQNQFTGACMSGTTTNSLTIANLSLELREDDGVTIVAAAAANPAGSNEAINTSLPAGTYYARVFEAGAFSESQLYSLNITVGAIDCDLNGVSDAAEIAGSPDLDCNDNAVLDECDIAEGTSSDANLNGIPDECESSTTTEVLPINLITATSGTFSGATADVNTSNNAYVFVNPALNPSGSQWLTDERFDATSPVADIIQLDIKTEVGENVNTIKTTKIYLYNWDTLTWTLLTSYGQPAADTIKIFTNIADPDAYVKDNNRKIRVRIRTQEDSATQPSGYQGRIDHVEVKVTY